MKALALVPGFCLAVLAGSAAAQLSQSETRALQIAALREFRATGDTALIHCIGVVEGALAQLGRNPMLDPDAAFLAQIGRADRVRPISACDVSHRDPESGVTLRDRQPARIVRLGAVELAAANEARLWIWGRAEGWRCTFGKHETAWGRPDCRMIFQT